MTAQRTNAAISATRMKGEAIVTALMSFVARNHRLPCPAIATRAPNTAGYGVEAVCTNTTPVPGGVRGGIVPWASLGLTNEQGSDAYHLRFTYFVREDETSRTTDTISAMRGNMTIHGGRSEPAYSPPAIREVISSIAVMAPVTIAAISMLWS